MIQRLQSVYLLLAGITATLLLFIPLARFNVSGQGYFSLSPFGIDSINVAPIGGTNSYLWVIALCTVLVAVCSFCSIFLFKHRMLQLKLTRWACTTACAESLQGLDPPRISPLNGKLRMTLPTTCFISWRIMTSSESRAISLRKTHGRPFLPILSVAF